MGWTVQELGWFLAVTGDMWRDDSNHEVWCLDCYIRLILEAHNDGDNDDSEKYEFAFQVSHHPPMLAQYCEGREWRCWQEFTMASKFRGKYLQVIPLGTAHLEFSSGKQSGITVLHFVLVQDGFGKLTSEQALFI